MFASDGAITLIKGFEGFRANWYQCEAGKWTIGYGHCRLPGDSYDSVSPAEAEAILLGDMAKMALKLNPLLTNVPTQNQFDAMLSLVFNAGVGYHDGKKGDFADSDLLAAFNVGDLRRAADEFLQWDKYHDPVTGELKVSQGLLNRRTRERALFLS